MGQILAAGDRFLSTIQTGPDVSEGQTLYNQTCQTCHDPAGQGSDRGPALNTGTFKHGSADADLFRAIRSGLPGTQMAPFGGLSDTQTWQLVGYVPASASGTIRPAATMRPRRSATRWTGVSTSR